MTKEEREQRERAIIKAAPRDPHGLAALTQSERLAIYSSVCSLLIDGRPSVTRRAFSRLSAVEQATVLAHTLHEYDTEMSGHVCVGIALPVRTRSDATNAKRFEEFTLRIEAVLNGFQEENVMGVAVVNMGEHGVMITGFRPPPAPLNHLHIPMSEMQDMSAIGMHAGPPPPVPRVPEMFVGTTPSHGVVKMSLIIQRLAMRASTVFGNITEKEVKEVVDGVLRGCSSDDIRSVLTALEQHMDEHKKGHKEADCDFMKDTEVIHKVLQQKLNAHIN